MDGRIMRHGIIRSCQSAATSEIVKRFWSRVWLCKQRYSKYPTFTFYLYNEQKQVCDDNSSDWWCYRYLPREVDPLVYNMSIENSGDVTYAEIGGLSEQIRELREVGIPLQHIHNSTFCYFKDSVQPFTCPIWHASFPFFVSFYEKGIKTAVGIACSTIVELRYLSDTIRVKLSAQTLGATEVSFETECAI